MSMNFRKRLKLSQLLDRIIRFSRRNNKEYYILEFIPRNITESTNGRFVTIPGTKNSIDIPWDELKEEGLFRVYHTHPRRMSWSLSTNDKNFARLNNLEIVVVTRRKEGIFLESFGALNK